ncbi:MAG: T9SS type A sorting domain-containing protein [Saprospiraceae bacterium]|nr:T9SS type A sorting domain-containing protein [Saprospiraceae bacterium]
MKNVIWALLWAIAIVPATAQKRLPVSLQPYVANFTYPVAKTLQKAGFALPGITPHTQHSMVQQRFSPLQLDSTKTFYGYDVPFPGDSTPLFRSKYRYEPLNVKIEENEQFEDGKWKKMSRNTFLGDGLGRDLEITGEIYLDSSQQYFPESRLLNYPHGNSKTLSDSIFAYSWNMDTQEWTLILEVHNQFDANDRLLESRSLIDLFGTPVWLKDKYFYDAQGDNIRIETYFSDGAFEVLTAKVENAFENHQPVETIAYIVDDNSGFAPQSRVSRTFESGLEKETLSFEWNYETNDWQQTESIRYDYDSAKRVIFNEKTFYVENGPAEQERITYAYKDEDNLALESIYFGFDNNFFLSDRKYYYYSGGMSGTNDLKAEALTLRPNPTLGQVQIQLDEQAVYKVFNATGELVSSGICQPNSTLQLNNLPTGMYFISAFTSNKMFSGRLVKI